MIYTVDNCPYSQIYKIPTLKRSAGNPKTRRKFEYKSALCAFDIETSNLPGSEQNAMYIWQFHIEGIGTIIGRTWNDFLRFLDLLSRTRNNADERFLVYVHNLSYEFQYLRGIYHFRAEDVFAIQPRKILRALMYDCFEFRCSYLQCNMSLENFTKSMGVEHEKISGFDYDKVRYFDTPLSDFEIAYCVHDVEGLVEAMRARIESAGDTFYTVPLTSTGYCRRDTKKIFRDIPRWYVKNQFPGWEVYTYLRRAFRGGNTHASRFYANVTLHNVESWDRSSSYPDVLVNHKYPVTEFYELKDATYKDVCNYIDVRERAVLIELAFYNLRLKDPHKCGCPYLPIAKCDCSRDRLNDNGRLLRASWARTVITDVDLRIIRDQYVWDDVDVFRMYHARYGYLPRSFRDLIKEYFHRKTALKGVEGREFEYRHSKELINALYGMCAQDPGKPLILFQDDDFTEDTSKSGPELLAAFYQRAVLPYQWGVWCPAWARYELQQMIDCCGRAFVYTDTDSVKVISGHADFTAYNEKCRSASSRSGAYADDPKGIRHFMGVAEYEGTYQEFKTLGAKKYVSRDVKGKLEITIAGVSKKLGGIELENAGGIEEFKDGFTFYDAGGLEAIYNDDPEESYYIREDGVPIPLTSNVYLRPSTYTLGLTAEYRRILEIVYI